MREPATFDEFWPIYLEAHASPETRALHFAGTAAAACCIAMFATTGRARWLAGALVAGYAPAWIGHALVEGNKPATFKHPLWSLQADFKMAQMAASGELDGELARLGIGRGQQDGAAA